MLRSTGDNIWPQPGIKAENRPASPPITKRWMWSALGTTGIRDPGSRLYADRLDHGLHQIPRWRERDSNSRSPRIATMIFVRALRPDSFRRNPRSETLSLRHRICLTMRPKDFTD